MRRLVAHTVWVCLLALAALWSASSCKLKIPRSSSKPSGEDLGVRHQRRVPLSGQLVPALAVPRRTLRIRTRSRRAATHRRAGPRRLQAAVLRRQRRRGGLSGTGRRTSRGRQPMHRGRLRRRQAQAAAAGSRHPLRKRRRVQRCRALRRVRARGRSLRRRGGGALFQTRSVDEAGLFRRCARVLRRAMRCSRRVSPAGRGMRACDCPTAPFDAGAPTVTGSSALPAWQAGKLRAGKDVTSSLRSASTTRAGERATARSNAGARANEDSSAAATRARPPRRFRSLSPT